MQAKINLKYFIVLISLSLLLIIIGLISFLPSLLSSGWGKKQIIKTVSQNFDGELSIGQLNLSWLGPQSIKQLNWKNERGEKILSIESFKTDSSLFNLWGANFLQEAVEFSELTFTVPNRGTSLQVNLSGQFQFSRQERQTMLKANGTVGSGTLDANIAFSLDHHWKLDFSSPHHFFLNAKQIPSAIFDLLLNREDPQSKELVTAALGNTFDLTLSERSDNLHPQLDLQIKAPQLSGNLTFEIQNGRLILAKPTSIDWLILPQFVKLVTSEELSLLGPSKSRLTVKEIDLPFSFFTSSSQLHPDAQIGFLSDLQIDFMQLQANRAYKPAFTLQPVQLKAQLEHGEDLLKVTAYTDLLQVQPSAQFDLKATFLKPNHFFELADIFSSPVRWQLNLNGIATSKITPLFTDSNWIGSLLGETFQIQSYGTKEEIFFDLNSGQLQIEGGHLKWQAGDGLVTVNSLRFSPGSPVFEQVEIPWKYERQKKRLSTKLHSTVLKGKVDGFFLMEGLFDHKTKPILKGNISLERLPTTSLPLNFGARSLPLIVGNQLDLNLQTNLSFDTFWRGTVDLTVKSEQIKGELIAKIDEEISVDKGSIQGILTPRGFDLLRRYMIKGQHEDYLLLQHPASVNLSISSLRIPRDWQKWEHALLRADLHLDRLVIVDTKKRNQMVWDNLIMKFETDNLADRLKIYISETDNNISVIGDIRQLLDSKGKVNLDRLRGNLEIKLSKFSVPIFAQLITADSSFSTNFNAVIGEHLSGKLALKLERSNSMIVTDLKGPNGEIFLDGTISGGILTLNKAFKATLRATPQLGQEIFRDAIPFLGSLVSSDQPLTLIIEPRGFSFPLFNYSVSQIQVSHGIFTTGKMLFKNEGQLKDIVSLFNKNLTKNITIWVLPIYFDQKEGITKIERTDMLIAGEYPIAVWGTVDFIRDKVKMVLGLLGQSLQKILRISYLDPEAVLSLPITGKVGSASIDRIKATQRISSLLIKKQGGAGGLVLGTLLDLTDQGIKEEIPPPTSPLPWIKHKTEKREEKKEAKIPDLKKALPSIKKLFK